jgi:DNA-binding SARP family transcriptional activator/tetratricopeptide (TPR) repeat protein
VSAETEFCLLGPLVVRRSGVVVPVPEGKQQALLAGLLLRAGRPAGPDELTEALWGSGMPPSARASLQNHVMRLRKTLEDDSGPRIVTEAGGYLIRVEPDELDVLRFESSLAAGREAARAGSWAQAAAVLRAGLSLWRGELLSGLSSDRVAAREAPRLAELRLQGIEARIEADLRLGGHAEVIAELRQLAAAEPLRERLHALLMTALYRDGQQAGALAAYQAARSVLIGELGAEPGPELRQLQQAVLAGDLTLGAPARPGASADSAQEGWTAGRQPGPELPGPPVPRQLPAATAQFTGRAGEAAALAGMLGHATGETMTISVIAGTAGVGKTALAVRCAHQAAGRFPDGQLHVNLRGYDPDQPVPAADALAGFLRALGVPGQDIPAELDERAARYRSLLAGRRVLVLLDNAGSVQQVRPLLPGTADCAVLVTSRDALAGLVALDGAQRLDLDLLPLAEAADLLRALIGKRAVADAAATEKLAVQCARLPLALRVAAEFAAARPAAPLAELVGELADEQLRLDHLTADDDPHAAVRAVLSWSYRHLDAAAARAFRLLSLHPGPEVDPYAAAALTGSPAAAARRVLDQLARAHLTQAAGPGRVSMHDLLRAYARELAASQEGENDRRAALTRLFDHYLHTAAAAMDTLFPAERDRRPRISAPGTPGPPVAEPDAARAWLDAERPGLILAAAYAAENGWPRHAIRLAVVLFRYLDSGGHYPEAVILHTHARRAASHLGDQVAEADALTSLGGVHFRQDRYEQAAAQYQLALTFYRAARDRAGEGRVLHSLGNVSFMLSSYRQAVGYYQQALTLFKETGDRLGAARAMSNLGGIEMEQGRYRQASRYIQQALTLFREAGNRAGEAHMLGNLGEVEMLDGRYQDADGRFRQALDLARDTGDRQYEAHALAGLGDVSWREGRGQDAADHYQQALVIFCETGVQSGEAGALNGLGQALRAAGRPGDARAQHAAALRLAGQIGSKRERARAHDGLGCSHHECGDPGLARLHWREALALYTELAAPEADEVRARLAAAGLAARLPAGRRGNGAVGGGRGARLGGPVGYRAGAEGEAKRAAAGQRGFR